MITKIKTTIHAIKTGVGLLLLLSKQFAYLSAAFGDDEADQVMTEAFRRNSKTYQKLVIYSTEFESTVLVGKWLKGEIEL